MSIVEEMQEISEQVSNCEKCALHFSRKKSVPGEGPIDSKLLFIGEGPGFNENEMGRPFVGQAGKFLEELLGYAGMKREEVFITNVVKCRPPGNRDPLPEELSACADYLNKQIELINPSVIVTLGRYSMARYFPNARISSVHGKPAWVANRLIVPMFHPAAALHQPALKNDIISDFRDLPNVIEQAQKARQVHIEPNPAPVEPSKKNEAPEQLSLF